MIVCALVSLLLPVWYVGKASLLPPEESQSEFGMMSALMAQTPLLTNFGLTGTPSEILVRILESRTIRERVIEANDLLTVWNLDDMELGIMKLKKLTRISVTPEGVIYLRLFSREPERAASLANSYVEALGEFNRDKRESSARRTREFVEQRLGETRTELAIAEEKLRGFEEKYSTVELPEQTKAALETASEILTQIVDREVRLGVLREDLSEYHPAVKQLERESAGLHAQINRILAVQDIKDSTAFYVPLEQIPEIKMEMVRLVREMEILNRMYVLLVEQYEQARIQEERNMQTVQVLDRASVPVRKDKPKRTNISLGGLCCGLFFGILLAFVAESGRRSGGFPMKTTPPAIREEIAAIRLFLKRALETGSDSREGKSD